MTNTGYFECERCSYETPKVLVPDYVNVLSSPCPECGGRLVRKA